MEKKSSAQVLAPEPASETLIEDGNLEYVNASGHVQELDRQFSFFSVFALGGTAGNAWGALAGSIVSMIVFETKVVASSLSSVLDPKLGVTHITGIALTWCHF